MRIQPRTSRRYRWRPSALPAVTISIVLSAGMAGTARADTTTTVPCGGPGGGGAGLASAIDKSNSSRGLSTIDLAAGCTYVLTTPAAPNDGLPIITGKSVINGRGATIVRVSAVPFRILEVEPGANLALDQVTISGGAVSLSGQTSLGGGILNGGRLTMTRSTVSDNTVMGTGFSAGGAGIANNGTVVLQNSVIRNNAAFSTGTHRFVAVGGGLLNRTGARMSIFDSVIADNSSTSSGSSDIFFIATAGGIGSTGALTLSRTQVVRNRTVADGINARANGAGMSVSSGTATIDGSNIMGNSSSATGLGAQAVGGGIENFGLTKLTSSSVDGNRASGPMSLGGGIFNGQGLVLTTSNVAGNVAIATTAAAHGGGIFNAGGTVKLQLSVVAGNTPDNCEPHIQFC